MPLNWKAVLVAAFIPALIRLVWYHPKLLGNAWMNAAGVPEQRPKWASTPLQFGLTLVFGFLIAAALMPMVIHQIHIFSLVQADPEFKKEGSEIALWVKSFMATYGTKHRSFGHGALHGAIAGLFFVTPILSANALFERRGIKYILINGGYWILSLTLMGSIICGWR